MNRLNPYLSSSSTVGAPETVSSWAFQELTRRIILGELAPEARITEEALVKELSVSRTPLREALKQLEELGLIVRQLNRTIRIAPLQTEEIVELVKIREHLEGLVVREVTIRAKRGDISTDSLWEVVRRIEAAEYQAGAEGALFDRGMEFHAHLLALSGLKRVERILYGVQLGLARYRRVNAADQRRLAQRSVEHRRILEAIDAGDADIAEHQMREHIREGLKVYTTIVNPSLSESATPEG